MGGAHGPAYVEGDSFHANTYNDFDMDSPDMTIMVIGNYGSPYDVSVSRKPRPLQLEGVEGDLKTW